MVVVMCMPAQPYNVLTVGAFEGFIPCDVREWLVSHPDHQHLADAFAVVNNKVGILHHEVCDIDDPWVEEAYETWCELKDELIDRIISVLKEENHRLHTQHVLEGIGTNNIVKPFMLNHGYVDGAGWWVLPD